MSGMDEHVPQRQPTEAEVLADFDTWGQDQPQAVWVVYFDDGDYYRSLDLVGVYSTQDKAEAAVAAEIARTDDEATSVEDDDGDTTTYTRKGYAYVVAPERVDPPSEPSPS